jgi:Zn-finger nucleic acid-binding protein
MDCPTCRNAMITLELADVEIDHCLHCGGVWLDAGELELFLEDPARAKALLDSFLDDPDADKEAPRKCPICDRRMAKVVVGSSQPPVRIDECRRGHGLWFDRGELEDVLRRGRLDENSRVLFLLADMFGRRPRQGRRGIPP